MITELHVVPNGDLVRHDATEWCACGPRAEPVPRSDGSIGWVHVHYSLDDREAAEHTEGTQT